MFHSIDRLYLFPVLTSSTQKPVLQLSSKKSRFLEPFERSLSLKATEIRMTNLQ